MDASPHKQRKLKPTRVSIAGSIKENTLKFHTLQTLVNHDFGTQLFFNNYFSAYCMKTSNSVSFFG